MKEKKYYCLLSGDHPEIGIAELKEEGMKIVLREENKIIAKGEWPENPLFAFVKETVEENSKEELRSINNSWRAEFSKKSFTKEEKERIIKELLNSIKGEAKVKGGEVIIKACKIGDQTIIGVKNWVNQEPFNSRKAHLRAKNHPTSLHPKLARAMINLTGINKWLRRENKIKYDYLVVDPFCGAGGILIEASLMKLKSAGVDIDEEQVKRAEENLRMISSLENVRLLVGDAFEMEIPSYAVVTDLPYGKNSKKGFDDDSLRSLLRRWSENHERAVIGYEEKMRLEDLVGDEWIIKEVFEIRIHKSMTKKIISLAKR